MSLENHNPNPNPNPNLKRSKDLIAWRRNIVLQRLSQGYNQSEIARELQVHHSTISLDVQFIREQSQEEMEHHISEVIPYHYALAMEGFRNTLQIANSIVQNNPDDKVRIQALILMSNTYERIMSIDMNGPTVAISINKVKSLEQLKQYRQQADDIEAKAAELMKQEEEATEEEEEEDAAEEE